MTCRDVMTSNPSCCVPSDSVAMAAQIMKREDVGPVLVVSDHHSRKLAGIVTDRDITLKVVAEGRDPHNTRLDEIMSYNPVTCHENDDTSLAVRRMGEHQVRRIPIVDSNDRLIGIVSQADLARHENEEEIGEMVEEISQPFGSAPWGSWTGRKHRGSADAEVHQEESDGSSGARSLAVGAVCLGVGAALMYALDPTRGRRRRAVIRDKALSLYDASGETLSRKSQDLRNRAAGTVASAKAWLKPEPVSDEKLVARVRSKMGRYVSHPHAIKVEANEGRVRLSGSILENEVSPLLECVNCIPGVQGVENHLDVHQTSGNVPELQGEGKRLDASSSETSEGNWTPSARIMAAAVGGGLLFYGLKSGTNLGKASATLGLGLITQGVADTDLARWTNLEAARKFVGI